MCLAYTWTNRLLAATFLLLLNVSISAQDFLFGTINSVRYGISAIELNLDEDIPSTGPWIDISFSMTNVSDKPIIGYMVASDNSYYELDLEVQLEFCYNNTTYSNRARSILACCPSYVIDDEPFEYLDGKHAALILDPGETISGFEITINPFDLSGLDRFEDCLIQEERRIEWDRLYKMLDIVIPSSRIVFHYYYNGPDTQLQPLLRLYDLNDQGL